MGALIPLLISLAPLAIKAVEKAFEKLPNSGTVAKMPTAIKILEQIAEGMLTNAAPLADGSQIKAGSVKSDVIQGIIENELSHMKQSGRLSEEATAEWFLVRGPIRPLTTS